MRVIAVYVGQRAQGNLQVGLTRGIWGFKADQPEYARIEPGDLLVIGSSYTGGSPRVQPQQWVEHSLNSLQLGRVTSMRYHDTSLVWPDEDGREVSYPYRFDYDHLGDVGVVHLGPEGPLGPEVAEALRLSAIAQGRGYVLDDPEGFVLDEHFPLGLVPAPDQGMSTVEPVSEPLPIMGVADLLEGFEIQLEAAGLRMPEHLPMRFLCGLLAKPFVILAGLSGSGKTQLALALGRWIGVDRTYVAAVRPDWTGAEALFGYENLLLPPDSDGRPAWSVPPVLEFMLQANDDPTEPHLLVLDEMNLAHVERYFADVLSGMESDWAVLPNLAKDERGIWRVSEGGPDRIPLPENLLLVGTVNVDETTYQFSPKVLDRSTTLEFRVDTDALAGERPELSRIEPAAEGLRRLLGNPPPVDPSAASEVLRKELHDLHERLSAHGREFGHRTYQEMLRFAAFVSHAKDDIDDEVILDFLVLQKVLPRIHGSSRELAPLMAALSEFVGIAGSGGGDASQADGAVAGAERRLPLSAEKLTRMRAELDATHFTAF